MTVWQLLDRTWRLVGTAVSFAAFGVGGLLSGLVFFPALHLVTRDRSRRKRYARAAIRRLFRAFVALMAGLGVLRWRTSGIETIEPGRPCLIIANHPSLIDVVFLLAFLPWVGCVVKSSLWRNPSMGPMLHAAGYISNRTPLETLQDCISAIAAGDSLVLFPEGTRTRPGQPIHFTPGAAAIALRARCPVVPVLISCRPATLAKGEPWYRIPRSRVNVSIDVQPALDVDDFLMENNNLRDATRRLNRYLEDYFRARVS